MTETVQESFKKALALHQGGNLVGAEVLYHQILAQNPNHDETLHLLGLIRVSEERYEEGAVLIHKALEIDPNFAAAHLNLGTCLQEMGKLGEAEASYRTASLLQPKNAQIYNALGLNLWSQYRDLEALENFNEALKLKPDFAEAHFNRGSLLNKLKQHQMALMNLGKAIDLRPHYPDAYYLRGLSLHDLDFFDKALKSLKTAEEQGCTRPDLQISIAKVLQAMGRNKEAVNIYRNARTHDGQDISPKILMGKAALSIWDNYESDLKQFTELVDKKSGVGGEFLLLQLVDSPHLQKNVVVRNAKELPARKLQSYPKIACSERPIKIGYFSPDFKNHPVSQLLAGVIEHHDRSKFRIELFSLGLPSTENMQHRMINAADSYQSIRMFTQQEAVNTLDARHLDIAIDLAGYTTDAMTGIFSRGIAPIQINYLGYPGTLGIEAVQYIIADSVVIPFGSEDGYTEKIVRLPHSFFPNDRSRAAPTRSISRLDAGLPETGFVFCALNNLRKLTPVMFDVWADVLKQIPGSVLWLPGGNSEVENNLRHEAQTREVDPKRLIFAPKVSRADYFERFKCADLFLDAFPYNAHTVAADTLWGGLPILTYAGESFASRVAASLLTTMGLSELIAHSFDEYKSLAISLARDPQRLAELTRRLRDSRDTSPLFEVDAYTKHLEAAFVAMVERHNQGLPPDHITINA
jgi:predicted O-linked N-acetylglucosamine transferase (SPINDLY family)